MPQTTSSAVAFAGAASPSGHGVAAARIIQLILLGEIRCRLDSIGSTQAAGDRIKQK